MIKTLQSTLKQDKEGFNLPKSVQDAIPIRRLWPDGIFQFGSKFSKTIRFSDINYAIASKEDKTSMFLGYSELLNALDTGSTTKITINNKRLNRQNFEQEILISSEEFLGKAVFPRTVRGAGAVHHPLRPPQERGGGPQLLRPGDGGCDHPAQSAGRPQ